MVCVDRKKMTCICGCSLTQATAIFGVVMCCGVIFSGLTGGYGFFGFFQVIMGIMMIVVCCIPYNVQYRRILYISYIIFLCLELLLLIVVVIIVLAVDDLFSESCSDYSYGRYSYYSSYYSSTCDSVDDALRTWYIIVLVVWACIYIPIGLIGLQICYWGWKEQDTRGERKEKEAEKKKEKKEAKKAMEMQQQQQMMMMQQQQNQPGQYPMIAQQPGQVPIGQPMTASGNAMPVQQMAPDQPK